jgi:cell division protein ZipA
MGSLRRHADGHLESAALAGRRIARALGPEPLEDARHLLPPLTLPREPPHARSARSEGPHPGREFVVDLVGAEAAEAERALRVVSTERRAVLHFPRFWGRPAGRDTWTLVEQAHPATRYGALALCWDLSALLSDGPDAARDLGAYAAGAAQLATELGRTAAPRETPEEGARRAGRLLALRERFGRSVEMRLMPTGRAFPARDVWRAAYALGLEWGDLDLFHWHDPASGRRLFTLSAVGQPGYFVPERAAEGEGINGIALGFELPYSPAPLPVFDRMAVALAYLRQKLGGRPTTTGGRELDADRLDEARDALAETVAEMASAGMAPGSPEAAGFF